MRDTYYKASELKNSYRGMLNAGCAVAIPLVGEGYNPRGDTAPVKWDVITHNPGKTVGELNQAFSKRSVPRDRWGLSWHYKNCFVALVHPTHTRKALQFAKRYAVSIGSDGALKVGRKKFQGEATSFRANFEAARKQAFMGFYEALVDAITPKEKPKEEAKPKAESTPPVPVLVNEQASDAAA